MKLKSLGLALVFVMLASAATLGAVTDAAREAMKLNQEMRKNIAWTVEGLYALGTSKDKKLQLTKAQAGKILPIYQEMIKEHLIQMEVRNPQNNSGNNGNRTQGFSQRNGEGISPERQQKLVKRLTEMTELGQKGMDQIDAVLTPDQVDFIDGMTFSAEKYGFVNFEQIMAQNGAGMASPDPQKMKAIREKAQEGRKRLVKLNQALLQLLNKMK